MIYSSSNRAAKSLALSFMLALIAGGAAEAQSGYRSGYSVSRQPTPVVRDHRGPSGMSGGGVTVSSPPARFGASSRNPAIRDHRGSCEFGVRRRGGCAS